jgi:hypothetical protein
MLQSVQATIFERVEMRLRLGLDRHSGISAC